MLHRRRWFSLALASALAAVLGSIASVERAEAQATYPPGPSGTCTDTLAVTNIQDPGATCHPAVLDRVNGITGVVVGFDAIATAYGFYIQTAGGGPYTGIDVFTGGTNYAAAPYNLAIGDLVVVYGRTQMFPNPNGEMEIEGPDGVQSTNDILIRKVSSGNAIPAFQSLTPLQMSWVPGAAGSDAARWPGCLVSVTGPLVVIRSTASLSTTQTGMISYSFMVAPAGDTTNVSARVLVDGLTLAGGYTPPTVGTVIEGIQGIPNRRTSSGVNSWRVQLRDGNDVIVAAPPNLARAYSIENDVIRVVFDRNVDVATAQNPANYTIEDTNLGGTTTVVNSATVEGGSGRFVRLNLTSDIPVGRVSIDVRASGIGSAACPTCLMGSQASPAFAFGVIPISTIQAADPSAYGNGQAVGWPVTLRGMCTGVYGSLYYVQDPATGKRAALSVYAPIAPLVPGHNYLIVGAVQTFQGETEIISTQYIVDEGIGTLPEPAVVTTAILSDTTHYSMTGAHAYEGMLVRVPQVRATESHTIGQAFPVAGPALVWNTPVAVGNLNGVLSGYTPPSQGQLVDVVGVAHIVFGVFQVCPRSAADVTASHLGDVTLSTAGTVDVDMTIDTLTVASGGTLTAQGTLTVTHDMIVRSGGVVTHALRDTAGLRLNVSGTLEVQSGGLIDLNGKGLLGGSGAAPGRHSTAATTSGWARVPARRGRRAPAMAAPAAMATRGRLAVCMGCWRTRGIWARVVAVGCRRRGRTAAGGCGWWRRRCS